nr:histidine--tRNA ligase [Bacteroidia bacterium]
LADVLGEPEKIIDITVAIDKLDKIGKDKVLEELESKGLGEKAIKGLLPLIDFQGNNSEKTQLLQSLLGEHPAGRKGIEEIRFLQITFNWSWTLPWPGD